MLDELIKFAIQQWPGWMSALVLLLIVMAIFGAPIALIITLGKWLGKDRYVLSPDSQHLYRLDTTTGQMHKVTGAALIQLEIVPPRTPHPPTQKPSTTSVLSDRC